MITNTTYKYTAKPNHINLAVEKHPHLDDLNFTYDKCRLDYYLYKDISKAVSAISYSRVLECTYAYHLEEALDRSDTEELELFTTLSKTYAKFINTCGELSTYLGIDKFIRAARYINSETLKRSTPPTTEEIIRHITKK